MRNVKLKIAVAAVLLIMGAERVLSAPIEKALHVTSETELYAQADRTLHVPAGRAVSVTVWQPPAQELPVRDSSALDLVPPMPSIDRMGEMPASMLWDMPQPAGLPSSRMMPYEWEPADVSAISTAVQRSKFKLRGFDYFNGEGDVCKS